MALPCGAERSVSSQLHLSLQHWRAGVFGRDLDVLLFVASAASGQVIHLRDCSIVFRDTSIGEFNRFVNVYVVSLAIHDFCHLSEVAWLRMMLSSQFGRAINVLLASEAIGLPVDRIFLLVWRSRFCKPVRSS